MSEGPETIEFLQLKNSNLPDFVVEQYLQIQALYVQEQYYAALWKAKDFLEVFFKYPDAICIKRICDYLLSHDKEDGLSAKELNDIKLILSRILAKDKLANMGDFIDISGLLINLKGASLFQAKVYQRIFTQLEKIKNANNSKTVKIINESSSFNSFAEWRNRKLGHGALNVNKTQQLADLKAILEAINRFLISCGSKSKSDTLLFYEGLKNFYGEPQPLVGSVDNRLVGMYEREILLVTPDCTDSPISLSPFIFAIDDTSTNPQVLILERFDSYNNIAHVINYTNGCFYLEARLTEALSNVRSRLNFKPGSNNLLDADRISQKDDARLADLLLEAKSLIKNDAFISPVNEILKKDKAILWLLAERGMGKSIFALQADAKTFKTNVFKYRINGYYNAYWDAFATQFVLYVKSIRNNLRESDNYFVAEQEFQLAFRTSTSVQQKRETFKAYLQAINLKLLIIIDGIDELPEAGEQIINPNVFLDHQDFPKNIYVLLLSRPFHSFSSTYIDQKAVNIEFHEIKYDSSANKNAIEAYLKTAGLTLNKLISLNTLKPDEQSTLKSKYEKIKNEIKTKSGYRFIYISALTNFFKLKYSSDTYASYDALLCVFNEYLELLKAFPGYEPKAYGSEAATKTKNFTQAFIEAFYVEYSKLSSQYADELLKNLAILALCQEGITLQELSYLSTRISSPNFKMLGIVSALNPFISIERSEFGNLLVINKAWQEAICQFTYQGRCFAEETKAELKAWAQSKVNYGPPIEESSRPFKDRIRKLSDNEALEIIPMGYSPLLYTAFSREDSLLITCFYPFERITTTKESYAVFNLCTSLEDYEDARLLKHILNILDKLNAKNFQEIDYFEGNKTFYEVIKEALLEYYIDHNKLTLISNDPLFSSDSVLDLKAKYHIAYSKNDYKAASEQLQQAMDKLLKKNNCPSLEALLNNTTVVNEYALLDLADLSMKIGFAKEDAGTKSDAHDFLIIALNLYSKSKEQLIAKIKSMKEKHPDFLFYDDAMLLKYIDIYILNTSVYLMEIESENKNLNIAATKVGYKKIISILEPLSFDELRIMPVLNFFASFIDRLILILDEAKLENQASKFLALMNSKIATVDKHHCDDFKSIQMKLCFNGAWLELGRQNFEKALENCFSWLNLTYEAKYTLHEYYEEELENIVEMMTECYVVLGTNRHWFNGQSGVDYLCTLLKKEEYTKQHQVLRREIVCKYLELESQHYNEELVLIQELQALLGLLEQAFEALSENVPYYFQIIRAQCLAKHLLLSETEELNSEQESQLKDIAYYFIDCPEYVRFNVIAAGLKARKSIKTTGYLFKAYAKTRKIRNPWKYYKLSARVIDYIENKEYLKGIFCKA